MWCMVGGLAWEDPDNLRLQRIDVPEVHQGRIMSCWRAATVHSLNSRSDMYIDIRQESVLPRGLP